MLEARESDILTPRKARRGREGPALQISKYFKPEALMFAAFLATLPIYSPNQLLFETELLQRAAYMPAFANTLLGAMRCSLWLQGSRALPSRFLA